MSRRTLNVSVNNAVTASERISSQRFEGHLYGDVTGGTITGTITGIIIASNPFTVGTTMILTGSGSTAYNVTSGVLSDTAIRIARDSGTTNLVLGDSANTGGVRTVFDFTDAGATARNWFIEGEQASGNLVFGYGTDAATGTPYMEFDVTTTMVKCYENILIEDGSAADTTATLFLNYQVASAARSWQIEANAGGDGDLSIRYNTAWTSGGTEYIHLDSATSTIDFPSGVVNIGGSGGSTADLNLDANTGSASRWAIRSNAYADGALSIGYNPSAYAAPTAATDEMLYLDYNSNVVDLKKPGSKLRFTDPTDTFDVQISVANSSTVISSPSDSGSIVIGTQRGFLNIRTLDLPNNTAQAYRLTSGDSSSSHAWQMTNDTDSNFSIGWLYGTVDTNAYNDWSLLDVVFTPAGSNPNVNPPTVFTCTFPYSQVTFSALTNTDGNLLSRNVVEYGNATESGASGATVDPVDIFTGCVVRDTAGTPTDTLPTAANLDAELNSTYDQPNGNNGQQDSPRFIVVFDNQAPSGTWTINHDSGNGTYVDNTTGSISVANGYAVVTMAVRRNDGTWTFNVL